MDLEQAAAHLGVDVASLEPAPAKPTRWDYRARYGLDPKPCSACGQPTRSSGVLDHPTLGPRWLDQCRTCFLATPPRARVPLEQMLADLREIAAEMGVPLTILTDGSYPAVVNDERYRLTLYLHGRRTLDGWWAVEATARRKWSEMVGEYGSLAGARIVLIEREDGGRVVASWPDPVVGGAS